MLVDIIKEAASVPLHAMKEMQQEMLNQQGMMHMQSLAVQSQLMQQLTASAAADPLRKLREKDPQFPSFTGKSEHFLGWIVECQTRKEQRDLADAVAIQYAILAMGETFRGLFPAGQQFADWATFVRELKPKFLQHTMDWSLVLETNQWKMEGDWPRFHSRVQKYRLFIDESFHPTLMLNLVKALDPYLQRKVLKDPKPTTLDEAIARAWQAFRTSQPPIPNPPTSLPQRPLRRRRSRTLRWMLPCMMQHKQQI